MPEYSVRRVRSRDGLGDMYSTGTLRSSIVSVIGDALSFSYPCYILVPKLTFAGTKAPHCTTSHADWSSNTQRTAMNSRIIRVNNGIRKM